MKKDGHYLENEFNGFCNLYFDCMIQNLVDLLKYILIHRSYELSILLAFYNALTKS